MDDRLTEGYVQIYTGDGKGKTTAALGQALRALGRGLKVYMVQFMKPPDSSGEHFSARAFGSNMVIKPAGRKGFILKRGAEPADRAAAQTALAEAREAMASGEYNLVILDEANVAVSAGVLDLGDLTDFIAARPAPVELIVTGRKAHPKVMALADLVSEITPLKHYYQSGVRAREGIEY